MRVVFQGLEAVALLRSGGPPELLAANPLGGAPQCLHAHLLAESCVTARVP